MVRAEERTIARASMTLCILLNACFLGACAQREQSAVRPEAVTIGPDPDTSGNYWGRNVSEQFGRPELSALHQEMNSAQVRKEVEALDCGKTLAAHEYSVTLWPEGEYQERIVRLQMTPRLYLEDGCLLDAVNYVFQRNVKAMDPGPPIDYGYKDPLTGKPIGPSEYIQSVPEKPDCVCGS